VTGMSGSGASKKQSSVAKHKVVRAVDCGLLPIRNLHYLTPVQHMLSILPESTKGVLTQARRAGPRASPVLSPTAHLGTTRFSAMVVYLLIPSHHFPRYLPA
jgi:hypothetical protein